MMTMPIYQQHLLSSAVNAKIQPPTNLMNKRRRTSHENVSKYDHYAANQASPYLVHAKVANEKLVL